MNPILSGTYQAPPQTDLYLRFAFLYNLLIKKFQNFWFCGNIVFWVYEISNFEYRYYPAPFRHPHRETDIVGLRFFVFLKYEISEIEVLWTDSVLGIRN